MRSHFRLSPEAEELVKIDPGYSQHVVFSRFDALLEGESLKLLEFNCDAPAGAAYTDQLESVFLSEELIWPFAGEHHLVASERVQSILSTLLSVYEEFGGYETPQIAIVDRLSVEEHLVDSPRNGHINPDSPLVDRRGQNTECGNNDDVSLATGNSFRKIRAWWVCR